MKKVGHWVSLKKVLRLAELRWFSRRDGAFYYWFSSDVVLVLTPRPHFIYILKVKTFSSILFHFSTSLSAFLFSSLPPEVLDIGWWVFSIFADFITAQIGITSVSTQEVSIFTWALRSSFFFRSRNRCRHTWIYSFFLPCFLYLSSI